jgi:hypothetical protein
VPIPSIEPATINPPVSAPPVPVKGGESRRAQVDCRVFCHVDVVPKVQRWAAGGQRDDAFGAAGWCPTNLEACLASSVGLIEWESFDGVVVVVEKTEQEIVRAGLQVRRGNLRDRGIAGYA